MQSVKVVTRQDRANTAAERWKSAYYDASTMEWSYIVKTCGAKGVYEKLAALPHPVDLLAVDGIVGNEYWTQVDCDRCNRSVDAVVLAVNEGDREDIALCFGCVKDEHEAVRVYEATHARAPDTF